MTIEEADPIGALRKKRLAKGTWKAERRRLLALEKKVGSHTWSTAARRAGSALACFIQVVCDRAAP